MHAYPIMDRPQTKYSRMGSCGYHPLELHVRKKNVNEMEGVKWL